MNVPHFGAVREAGVYPGVDLVYRTGPAGVEYDFVVAPGAEPRAIRLRFSGADGVRLDEHGDVRLRTQAGELRHARPVAFQGEGPARREVRVAYVERDQELRLDLGRYDHRRPLVIDPVVSYS